MFPAFEDPRASWTGPLGRGRPKRWEPSDPQERWLPVQPTERKTITIPVSGSSTWNPIDITVPKILRLRSLPVATPSTGVENIEMFTAQEGEVPRTITDGFPAFGNYAILDHPGRWYWSVFANIQCTLDLEVIDCANQSAFDIYARPPKAHTARTLADAATGAATDIVLFYANQFVERRALWVQNNMNVAARLNFGAAASATTGITFIAPAAGQVDRLYFDEQHLPLQSVHVFGTGTGTTVAWMLWT